MDAFTEVMEGTAAPFGESGADRPRGTWDGRCHDPGLEMFRKAYDLACRMGIAPEAMPELRTENGVLHAFRPDGSKIRLEKVDGWESRTGYLDLLLTLRRGL